jgi:cytochrome bd ubiquinol oxidase subunit I
LPFSWEGTAFFVEAIALGLFLYGWDRLPPRVHFASGVVVGVAGVASGVLVISANAWMNSPRGFRWVDGRALDIDPVAAMFNDAWASQALHMVIAAFIATCFAVAGVHAIRMLRGHRTHFHQRALRSALGLGSVFALLQPLSGDFSAKDVARRQPAKLAAMEALYRTERGAPLLIGGFPDDATEQVRYAIEIPYALSVLAHGDPNAEVQGLDRVDPAQRPPTLVTHLAFQVMIMAGMALVALALCFLWLRWRRPAALDARWFLRLVALGTPLGFIAVEAGWTVTEVGRQPWIIYGVMTTKQALSSMPGLVYPLIMTVIVYLLLALIVYAVLARLVRAVERGEPRGGADG